MIMCQIFVTTMLDASGVGTHVAGQPGFVPGCRHRGRDGTATVRFRVLCRAWCFVGCY